MPIGSGRSLRGVGGGPAWPPPRGPPAASPPGQAPPRAPRAPPPPPPPRLAGHPRVVKRLDRLARLGCTLEIGRHRRVGQLLPSVGDAPPCPRRVAERRVLERGG